MRHGMFEARTPTFVRLTLSLPGKHRRHTLFIFERRGPDGRHREVLRAFDRSRGAICGRHGRCPGTREPTGRDPGPMARSSRCGSGALCPRCPWLFQTAGEEHRQASEGTRRGATGRPAEPSSPGNRLIVQREYWFEWAQAFQLEQSARESACPAASQSADELGSLTKRFSLGGRRWWRPPTRLRAALAPPPGRPTVEDDGDRPLIGQVEPHACAEHARLDRDSESPERRAEPLV